MPPDTGRTPLATHDHQPGYRALFDSGRLQAIYERLSERLGHCRLCPRRCGVDRLADDTGTCRTGKAAIVASFSPHFGEEPELVGDHGSGTIFFTHCNLLCNFCQNDDISHGGTGHPVTDDGLATIMIRLQEMGCHNINFVTPTHVVPQIIGALLKAVPQGLRLPLVYNSSGYDRVGTLQQIEGVFDIYMPDFKFWDRGIAAAACDAPDYPEVAAGALREMHRQVGDLQVGPRGVAHRGLIVRHLVLPENLAGTEFITRFIAAELSTNTTVNIMSQYRPCHRAADIPALRRRITVEEFREAVAAARSAGLNRLSR